MNDKLQNVLAELAAKFGTSVDHLWGVMLKQAVLSGIGSIVKVTNKLVPTAALGLE